MRRIISAALVLLLVFSLFSCSPAPKAEEMLSDFLYTYGIEGIIYSPSIPEGGDGYITEELFDKIYIYEGSLPKNCAIFLNTRTDKYVECAIFVTESEEERAAITDMCTERIALIDKSGDSSFILRSGAIVFYSTLPDKERARSVIDKILGSYTWLFIGYNI